MSHFSVHIANEAWHEIMRKIRYIAIDRQAPVNAARWSNRLLKLIDDLGRMPRRHTVDEHLSHAHGTDVYRLVFEQTYLLFCTIKTLM